MVLIGLYQARVFVLKLPEAAELAHAQVRVLLLPRVEPRLADPQLPAEVPDPRARLDLPQRIGDLLLGELRPGRFGFTCCRCRGIFAFELGPSKSMNEVADTRSGIQGVVRV